jgi:Zn-dependent protease with chaperone function
MTHAEKLCPTCGTAIPVNAGYISWCECGWNLAPPKSESSDSEGVIERIRLKLGDRMAKDLFAKVVASPSLAPEFNLSKLLALAFATLVHLTTLFFVVIGIVMISSLWPNVFGVAGGVLALCIAWVLRPRFGKKPENPIPREEFPALYGLADDVAARLGLKPIEGIVLTTDFNAAFAQIGLQRRSYIFIGLPLFSILTPQERVSVIAHEIAHGVNGDQTRSLYIGSAIDTLSAWYYLLMPVEILSSESGLPGLMMAPMNLLLAGLAKIAYGGAYLLLLLTMRDSQRAEYLADYLESTVSGTETSLSALDKLYYGDTYSYALQRAALNNNAGTVFDQLSELMASTPEREIERIRRIGEREGSRIDASHPPTVYRRQFLEARRVPQPQIVLTSEEAAAVDSELRRCYAEANKRALDEYRRWLYA